MEFAIIELVNNNIEKPVVVDDIPVRPVERKLTIRTQIAFGFGHVLNDMCSSIWFSYLLLFLKLVLEFEDWQAGFFLLIGQIADAIANPFVGYFSDQPDSLWMCKYGKRKIWHLIGTSGILATLPLVFWTCVQCSDSSKGAQMFYFSVFIIIFQFGWAAVQISHLSLIPELTADKNMRTRLTAIRYGFTVISNIMVYLITFGILGIDNETKLGPGDAIKFQGIVWSILGIGIFSTIIFHCFIKEEDQSQTNNENSPVQVGRSISEIFSSFEHYRVALVYMSTMLYVNLNQVFVSLFLYETLEMSAKALALIPLTIYGGSFGASLVVSKLNNWFGRKGAYMIGTVVGVTACIWIQVRSDTQSFINVEINVVAVFIGITSAIILVTNLGITADLIGNETGNGAFIYSIMTFTDKLGNGISVFLIENFHKNFQEKTYYQNVLVFVCGGALILGTISVITLARHKHLEGYNSIPSSNDNPVAA